MLVVITEEFLEEVKAKMPGFQQRRNGINELGLTEYDASILDRRRDTSNSSKRLQDYGKKITCFEWMMNKLGGCHEKVLGSGRITPQIWEDLISMVDSKKINT
jgi:Asp-tRNA(Asn)/Glu-tRNA(Gln) amidotransferase B subunit